MNIEEYKRQIKSWSCSFLEEQLSALDDSAEMCWSNAHETTGTEKEHWLSEYNTCDLCYKACKEELERRIDKTDNI